MVDIAAVKTLLNRQGIRYAPEPLIIDLGDNQLINPGEPDGIPVYDEGNETEPVTRRLYGATIPTATRRTATLPQLTIPISTPNPGGIALVRAKKFAQNATRASSYVVGPFLIETAIMDLSGTNSEGAFLVGDVALNPDSYGFIYKKGEALATPLTAVASAGTPLAGEYTQAAGPIFEFEATEVGDGKSNYFYFIARTAGTLDAAEAVETPISSVYVHQKYVLSDFQILHCEGIGEPVPGGALIGDTINPVIQFNGGEGCTLGASIWFGPDDELFPELCA